MVPRSRRVGLGCVCLSRRNLANNDIEKSRCQCSRTSCTSLASVAETLLKCLQEKVGNFFS